MKHTSFVPPRAVPDDRWTAGEIEAVRLAVEELMEQATQLIATLREQHAHVPIGDPGYCPTCDVDWPCMLALPMFGWPGTAA